MRIIGFERNGRAHVAAPDGIRRVPLGDVDQFWCDLYAGIAAVNQVTERLDPSRLTLVPPVKPSARVVRVEGPVMLVEFDNTEDNANHIHAV